MQHGHSWIQIFSIVSFRMSLAEEKSVTFLPSFSSKKLRKACVYVHSHSHILGHSWETSVEYHPVSLFTAQHHSARHQGKTIAPKLVPLNCKHDTVMTFKDPDKTLWLYSLPLPLFPRQWLATLGHIYHEPQSNLATDGSFQLQTVIP